MVKNLAKIGFEKSFEILVHEMTIWQLCDNKCVNEGLEDLILSIGSIESIRRYPGTSVHMLILERGKKYLKYWDTLLTVI